MTKQCKLMNFLPSCSYLVCSWVRTEGRFTWPLSLLQAKQGSQYFGTKMSQISKIRGNFFRSSKIRFPENFILFASLREKQEGINKLWKEISENVVWLWPGGSPEWLVVEVSTEGSNVLEDFLEEISENVGWSGPPPLFALEDTWNLFWSNLKLLKNSVYNGLNLVSHDTD